MQTASQKNQASADTAPTESDPIEDPLIGRFAGSPDLAARPEEILGQKAQSAAAFI